MDIAITLTQSCTPGFHITKNYVFNPAPYSNPWLGLQVFSGGIKNMLTRSYLGGMDENRDHLQELTDNAGHKISPGLPDTIKNFLIDIDGTICDDIPNEEPWRMETATVYQDALETINKWYDAGHIITFFTSRTDEHREVTENWLKQNGFRYHYLLLNKPRGGNYHWIDNHIVQATRYMGKFTDLVDSTSTIQVFKD
jgi:hypothetical protein